MKTLYCLGGSPQFRIPCLKYSFLLKEKENKNIFTKNDTIPKDFNNLDEKEKKTIIEEWMDQIYPKRAIKKCLQINPSIKLKMKAFYRHLRESLSKKEDKTTQQINKNDNNINNRERRSSINIHLLNKNKKDLKLIINRNNSNFRKSIFNISNYHKKFYNLNNPFKKEDDKKIQIDIIPSRNIPKINLKDFSGKLFNYYYPISNESNSIDLCQSLISKHKTKRSTQLLSISNNNNSLTNNSNSKTIFNSKFLNIYENNKTLNENSKSENKNNKHITSQIININDYKKKIKFKKFKNSKSLVNSINKRKKRRGLNHQNKLNILYSDNEEQFYRKYDKHRKRKILNGLGLTHINSSPKVILNELNQKINTIKNKVETVKSIVDKTFPKVLADITLTKNKYKNSKGKEAFNSPYIQRLNKIKKHQKFMNSFFLDPVKIISRNRKSNFDGMKKNSLFNI